MFKATLSMRWQLPLTYALIALVASVSLGAVMLEALERHYRSEEQAYLERNARTLTNAISAVWSEDIDLDRLAEQIRRWAFLPQTRITLLDTQGNTLVDSGAPGREVGTLTLSRQTEETAEVLDFVIEGVSVPSIPSIPPINEAFPFSSANALPAEALTMPPDREGFMYQIAQDPDPSPVPFGINIVPIEEVAGDHTSTIVYLPSSAVFGFIAANPRNNTDRWQREWNPTERARSDQVVTVDLIDPADPSQAIGSVRVSDGPAVGREIVSQVRETWLAASAVAVLLAAGTGWVVSRRITTPLLQLTAATARMAGGDLSTRTAIQRRDEFGTLATSFNHMADRIEATFTTLRRFVADAAHELHTPLTAIRANIELAGERHDPESARQAISELDRLQHLANDLLDLSRLEAASELPFATVKLGEMVRGISEVHAARAEQANIDFMLNLPQDEPVIVQGDERRLRRMLANLLDNAIKFTPEAGTISVSLHRSEAQAVLTVADTGIGIPEEALPTLFERFRRGRNAMRYPGSGIGLAIVKAVIDAHSGSIAVWSDDNGTTFTIYLPTTPDPAPGVHL